MRRTIPTRLLQLALVLGATAALSGCYTTKAFDGSKEAPLVLNDRWLAIYDLRQNAPSGETGAFYTWGYQGPDEDGIMRRCHYRSSQDVNVETKGFVDIFIPLDTSNNIYVNCENGTKKRFEFMPDMIGSGTNYTAGAIVFARTWKALGAANYDPAADANFAYLAQSWRAQGSQVNAELVRQYKIAAEVAVREKRLTDAVTQFRQGLNRVPTWPQGHFNIALLYAELNILEGAIDEMGKYLQLVPDATNARQAQDKIYEWRSKLPNGGR